MRLLRLIICLALFTACSKKENAPRYIIGPPPAPLPRTDLRILYIGNSLISSNALPEIVTDIAKQDSVTVGFKDMSLGNYSLEDHWNMGAMQTEIANGQYDYVVVSQGPSSLASSQVLLIEYVKRIKGVCAANNAKLCVYMVWPDKTRLAFLDDVINGYTEAAAQSSSTLAPAGLAWKFAWQDDPLLPLYSGDNFHPSVLGSTLAALTIYGAIKQKKDFGSLVLQNLKVYRDITPDQFIIIKQAAVKALK